MAIVKRLNEKFNSFEERFKDKIGLFYALFSTCAISVAALFLKYSLDFSVQEVIIYRDTVTLIISLFMLETFNVKGYVNNPKITCSLFMRSAIGIALNLFESYATRTLPISESRALSTLEPLLSGITGAIFLGESFEALQLYVFLNSMIGVCLIVKPPFLFDAPTANADNPYVDNSQRTLALIAKLFAVLLSSSGRILGRSLATKINNTLIFHYSLIFQIMFSSLSISYLTSTSLISPLTRPGIFLIGGITTFLGRFSATRALKYEEAGKVALMSYAGIVANYFIDIFVLGVIPDFFSTLGNIIIVVGVATLIIKKSKKKKGQVERGTTK